MLITLQSCHLECPPPPHSFLLFLPHRYFNSGSAPLECDKEFWDLRDSVVQCELLILRQLNFYVSFEHPHKVCVHVHMFLLPMVSVESPCLTMLPSVVVVVCVHNCFIAGSKWS